MSPSRGRWVATVARALVVAGLGGGIVAAGLFVAIRAANAIPGGPTRNDLSFSGTLRTGTDVVVTGAHALSFRFSHADTVVCTAPATGMVTPDPVTGAFAAQINLDMATPAPCPPWLFDGSNTTFEVLVDGVALTPSQRVNAVPSAHFADQAAVNRECPSGYERDPAEGPGLVCARTVTLGATAWRDEMVRVGFGATAFWIDRYEAAVHARTGPQLGVVDALGRAPDDVASSGLAPSGSHAAGEAPAVALSHPGQPSGMVSWFQASEACRLSGKRLVGRSEWFAAATGTPDGTGCNLSSAGPRGANPAQTCRSIWGVHDLIGSVWEWTDEWYASVGMITSAPPASPGARVTGIPANYGIQPWGSSFGDGMDGTWNVTTAVFGSTEGQTGLPAAAIRGAGAGGGPHGGVFALSLNCPPINRSPGFGFRCVVRQ